MCKPWRLSAFILITLKAQLGEPGGQAGRQVETNPGTGLRGEKQPVGAEDRLRTFQRKTEKERGRWSID